MGPGLNLETPEEIQMIMRQADGAPTPIDENLEPTSKRKTRGTTSKAWEHFIRGPILEDGSYDATCRYCGTTYKQGLSRSTGSLKHHYEKGCKKMPQSKRYKPDALQQLLQASKTSDGDTKVAPWVFDQMKSRKGLARMVIAHEYPFNCVNHYFLKVFLADLQPEFKIPSRNTLRKDCLTIYREEQIKLYEILGNLNCRVSFTSDLWSNKGHDRGFMAITCHWINDGWVLRKMLLTFTPLPSPHTGKNIAGAFYGKLVKWNLDKKVFSLVLDNASSNEACIKELMCTSLKGELPVSGNIFHQRCGCHILNLIVQDGLAMLSDEIKNIRETMKWIRHSQGRMEKFKMAVAQVKGSNKKPAWDVPTRWNSTYLMLDLAMELKPVICRYVVLDKNYILCPSEVEWDAVEALVEWLKGFYVATLKFSGTKYPTLNIFFPEFCEVYLSIKRMGTSPLPFIVEMGQVR